MLRNHTIFLKSLAYHKRNGFETQFSVEVLNNLHALILAFVFVSTVKTENLDYAKIAY